MTKKLTSLLLIGPTGSGKTPAGSWMEEHGIQGMPCFHFDFGAQLRRAADNPLRFPLLSSGDISAVRESLRRGTLLKDEQFPIAAALFRTFARTRSIDKRGLIVCNGLPRHKNQAEQFESLARVVSIVHLSCPAEIVHARIRKNTGGDRRGRVDDTFSAVEERLQRFRDRTMELLDFYRNRDVPVITVPVTADMSAEAAAAQAESGLVPVLNCRSMK